MYLKGAPALRGGSGGRPRRALRERLGGLPPGERHSILSIYVQDPHHQYCLPCAH